MVPILTRPLVPSGRRDAASVKTLEGPGIALLLLCAFLPVVDFFIVNVALPTIRADLHASAPMLELVVAGYGTSYAALLVIGGRLGDRFGRRRMLVFGVAGFAIASALCGCAPTAAALVAARILQGATAAALVPQVLATFQSALDGTRRTRAIGLWGAVAGAATVTGQAAGGLLVAVNIDGTGWRPVFLINVPICLVLLALTRRVVPDTRSSRPAGVDVPGTVLFAATLVAVLLPLAEGRTLGWPPWTLLSFAGAGVLAVTLAVYERRDEARGGVPLLPPSLLRVPSMWRGLALGVPFFMGFGGFMFAFAITVQTGLREGALIGGLAIAPFGIVYLLMSIFAARLLDRFGRAVVAWGSAIQTVGSVLLAAIAWAGWPDISPWAMAPALIVIGFGQPLVQGALFRLVLSGVPAYHAGVGGGVLITMQQSGLALGVAVLGTVFLGVAGTGTAGIGTGFAVMLLIIAAAAAVTVVAAGALPRHA